MPEPRDYELDPTRITATQEWQALMMLFAKMHRDLIEEMSLAVERNDMHNAALARGKVTMLQEFVDIPKYIGMLNQRERRDGRSNR